MPDLIYWTVTYDGQTPVISHSIPFESFLSPYELERLSSFRFPKRRSEWLHGRWSIKYLLRHSLSDLKGLPAFQVQVKNEPEGMPFIEFASNQSRLPIQISISHRDHTAFCALCAAQQVKMGVDLELVETRPPSFLEDYFTAREYAFGLEHQDFEQEVYFTLLWSIKEAVLKAVGKGLRLDTRRVEITEIEGLSGAAHDSAWRTARVNFQDGQTVEWRLWWRYLAPYIFSVAAGFPHGEASPQLVEVRPDLD